MTLPTNNESSLDSRFLDPEVFIETEPSYLELATTRRRFVLGGLAAGALLITRGNPVASDIAWAGEGWHYRDDRGVKIVLRSRPKRIVAYADAAAALWGFGILPVGVFGSAPIAKDPVLARLPKNKVTQVGAVYGEIELEKLAALRPDLIVSTWYPPPRDTVPFGFKDTAHLKTVGRIAPVLAFNAHVIATTALRRFGRLSGALGAELSSNTNVARKARFEKASQALRVAAAKRRSLRVVAISAFGGQAYIAVARDGADLLYFKGLGVNVITPNTTAPYWEAVSYEQIGKYPADIVIYDARSFATSRVEMMKVPTFAGLPAVQAGQLGRWHAAAPFDYLTYAANIEELTRLLNRSRKL